MIDILKLVSEIPCVSNHEFHSLCIRSNLRETFFLPILDSEGYFILHEGKFLVLGYFSKNLYLSYFPGNSCYVDPDPITSMDATIYNIGFLKYGNHITFNSDCIQFIDEGEEYSITMVWSPTIYFKNQLTKICIKIGIQRQEVEEFKKIIKKVNN